MITARLRACHLLAGAAMIALNAGVVHAQDIAGAATATPPKADTDAANAAQDTKEIVVTGTSLRGVAPAGAESLQVSQADVVASGATSTQALLADIPQSGTFANTPYSGLGGGTQSTANPENLRNLPQGTGGGSPTLVLMDGHRFAGDGVRQTIPDAGIIPPGMIDHVEVVLDGGSAVYGADAVGGVINFVTKRDFNGIQINGSHGFGDDYSTNNIDFLAGKKWDSGSVYIGYSYGYNTNILAADRAYEHQLSYASGVGLPAGTQCNKGNVQVGSNTYAITGTNPTTLAAGTQNLCDASKYGDLFPEEIRHSVMTGFRQQLTPTLELEVKGYYSYREDKFNSGRADGYTVTANSGTLGYTPITTGSTAAQQVSGNFSGVNGNYVPQTNKLTTWGITPTLNWSIGQDWHMKAFYNYSESRTTVHQPILNSNLLTSEVAAGTFNPYNPTAASNTAEIPALLNYENYGLGVSGLSNVKAVFDGTVFRLPGGMVKAAIGGEYIGESYHGIFQATDTPQNTVNTSLYPLTYYKRHEFSGFGEINLPLVSTLVLNVQERFDHYSDFGSNWAPSLGLQYKPVHWITLRGKWNKAFQAPSPANLANAGGTASSDPGIYEQFVPLLVNPSPNTLLGTLGGGGRPGAVYLNPIVDIQGSNPHLQPQRATTYDIGFDISPPIVPGLTLHGTYFHIDYRGIISMPPQGSSASFWTQFPANYAMNPTYAQVLSIMQAGGISASQIANTLSSNGINCTAASCNIYSISNIEITNLGGAKIGGLDLGADFRQPVPFGSLYARFNGTYLLDYRTSPSPSAPYSVNGVGNSYSLSTTGVIARFKFVATLGTTIGDNFRAQLRWNHADGGDVTPDNLGLGQTQQAAFNTFDFFAKYDLNRKSLPPISLTLTITNMFNSNPPVFNGGNGVTNGYADGTVGRVIQVGASVKF